MDLNEGQQNAPEGPQHGRNVRATHGKEHLSPRSSCHEARKKLDPRDSQPTAGAHSRPRT
eukprot:14576718-Alexandrium_andersonii.AAC.1